jgi:hypothetical protein
MWSDNQQVEEVSVYSVTSHPDFDFRMGDVVVKLPQAGATSIPSQWAGQILDIHSGKMKVCWVDKSMSLLGPEEIYPIDSDDEESEDTETYDVDYLMENENGLDFGDGDEGDEDSVNNYEEEDYVDEDEMVPEILEGNSIVSGIFETFSSLRWWAQDTNAVNNNYTPEEDLPTLPVQDQPVLPESGNAASNFPNFAVLEEVGEHHFANVNQQPPGRALSKRMITEWEMLKKSLPGM